MNKTDNIGAVKSVGNSDLLQYITANYTPPDTACGMQPNVTYPGAQEQSTIVHAAANQVKYSLADTTVTYAEDLYSAWDNGLPFSRGNIGLTLTFSDELKNTMNEKNLSSPEVYYAAGIDRRLFSKIISDRAYTPKKDTCIAICLGLKLTLEEAKELLSRAGYAFSHASMRDVIIEYHFSRGIYSLITLNCRLAEFGETPLSLNITD